MTSLVIKNEGTSIDICNRLKKAWNNYTNLPAVNLEIAQFSINKTKLRINHSCVSTVNMTAVRG